MLKEKKKREHTKNYIEGEVKSSSATFVFVKLKKAEAKLTEKGFSQQAAAFKRLETME